jgi:putative tryptophan/tyrosine transport system substrate-binding protein
VDRRVALDRRVFLTGSLGLLVAPLRVEAQPPKAPRIGYLRVPSPQPSQFEAFREGLKALGYIEGQSIAIEQRHADGVRPRLPGLAAELVRLNVDMIVVDTGDPTLLESLRGTIPIIFTLANDPVRDGLVASLARPGGNFTGLTFFVGYELAGKRLALLKEAIPKTSRVAVLANPANSGTQPNVRETEVTARALGLRLQVFEVRTPDELDSAFEAMQRGGVEALVQVNDGMLFSQRGRIVDLAARRRLPAVYEDREFVESGGLMSYGVGIAANFRRAATYVDKILKGAKPADLPVEQPTTFELVVNLEAAKALGLTIPPSVLARADTVIQ